MTTPESELDKLIMFEVINLSGDHIIFKYKHDAEIAIEGSEDDLTEKEIKAANKRGELVIKEIQMTKKQFSELEEI